MTIRIYTPPRELEPRWAKTRDQIACFATSYDPEHPVTPVRTVELAVLGNDTRGNLVVWRDIVAGPTLPPKAPGKHSLTLAMGDGVATLVMGERQQIVIREVVEIEPWDIGQRTDCGKDANAGICYLPTGHLGGCDADMPEVPDTAQDLQGDTTPERDGDAPTREIVPPRVDDLSAVMDAVA